MKLEDLTGQRFGLLLVKNVVRCKFTDRVKWLCQCDCGDQAKVYPSLLKLGKTKSCGCLRRKLTGEKNRGAGNAG